MLNLKRKFVTTILACCVLSSFAYGKDEVVKLSKKQGQQVYSKHLKLRKVEGIKQQLKKKKSVGHIAQMASEITQVMRANLEKSDPILIRALKTKADQINKSKIPASKKQQLLKKLIIQHKEKFKSAYYEVSKQFPNLERYIDKLVKSPKKVVHVGDLASISVVDKHSPSAPTGPRSFIMSAPYSFKNTEFSGTFALSRSATVNLEDGIAKTNLMPLLASYNYASAAVSEVVHIEPGYNSMRVSTHIDIDYRQIIGAFLGFSFTSTDVFLSVYGDNEKKCQIDTHVAKTLGALVWVAESKGREVIPVTCEFEVDNRGSEYSISVGTASVAMTLGYIAMTEANTVVEHISVDLYD